MLSNRKRVWSAAEPGIHRRARGAGSPVAAVVDLSVTAAAGEDGLDSVAAAAVSTRQRRRLGWIDDESVARLRLCAIPWVEGSAFAR